MPAQENSNNVELNKKMKNIFNSSNYLDNLSTRVDNKIKTDRVQLLSYNTSKELNTYLNFGVFPTFADTYPDDVKGEYDKNGNLISTKYVTPKGYGPGTPGVRSLFNRAGAVILGSSDGNYNVDIRNSKQIHPWRISNNVPLMDSPGIRKRINDTTKCSVTDLVKASENGILGQETYAYSDFMYCKYLGRVSNNYMITLRRFPAPVDDFIGAINYINDEDTNSIFASKNASSIGCMVTWLGVSGNEMSNILKYSFKMPFKEQTAELENDRTYADTNKTVVAGIFNAFDESYRKQYIEGYGGESLNAAFKHFGIDVGDIPYTDHRGFKDRNKVYGPIDAIKSTYIRSDEGLEFKQSMSLTFEYELRSYNGINPRQAMLDLISNILNVTYTTGSFWGGGIKSYGAAQSNIFTNLNIFKNKGGFTDFADAFSNDITNIWGRVSPSFQNESGEFSLKETWKTLKSAMNSLGGMLTAGMLNKMGRPTKAMYNSLLSPAPIGFWHVTIGNPKSPIMSLGNMIITNVTIEHNGPLGLDNFPTELKVTVELDRGKPRDLRDIEKIYMHGNDRIYAPMSDKVFNMYCNSLQYKASLNSGIDYNPVIENSNSNDESDTLYDYKNKKLNLNNVTGTTSAELTQHLKKYFGTDDAFSIYFAATEQEYGASKNKKK